MPDNRFWSLIDRLYALLSFLLLTAAAPTLALPGYNVEIRETSVSGISSGGYMALQFAVAHSDIVTGIGVLAGGPYRCGAEGISTALGTCMQGRPDPLKAIAETEAAARDGRIASPANIGRQQVWLFSGYNDGVVKQTVMDSLYDYIGHYVAAANIYYQTTLGAGHAMVTLLHGAKCAMTGEGFINDCDYDAAGLLLQHIYGKLNAPTPGPPTGKILAFDQSAYTRSDNRSIGLADTGYLYVPGPCASGERCRVHIAFHGCRQYAAEVDDLFYRNAGYNRWADNNRIIILYPQTQATHLGPFNPKGCWDWWGYTGPDFAFRDGLQIEAVRSVLDQLSQGYSASETEPADNPPELFAVDATSDSVALAWSPYPAASGYRLYRSSKNSGRFERTADIPERAGSHVDHGLFPETEYRYRLEFINDMGETMNSNTATIVTRAPPPACDPYFSDNVTHANKGRANVLFGFTFAKGSWDYMGLWNLFTETALFKEEKEFQVGVCSDG